MSFFDETIVFNFLFTKKEEKKKILHINYSLRLQLISNRRTIKTKVRCAFR